MIGVSYSAPSPMRFSMVKHLRRAPIDENHWVTGRGVRMAVRSMRFSHLLHTVIMLRDLVPAMVLEEQAINASLDVDEKNQQLGDVVSVLGKDLFLVHRVRCFSVMLKRLRLAGCDIDNLQRPPKYMAVNEENGRPVRQSRRPIAETSYIGNKEKGEDTNRTARLLAVAIARSMLEENGGHVENGRGDLE